MAAGDGILEVMRVLVKAGANPNIRAVDGRTALHNAVQVLLRAKADPLFASTSQSGHMVVPLGLAAGHGHLRVVRELMQELGIEGCGGATGGVHALTAAATMQQLEVMAFLPTLKWSTLAKR